MGDYSKYAFRITFLVVAAMLVMSLVPPFSIGDVHFRRTNILSDILVFDDAAPVREGELSDSDKEFLEDASRLNEPVAAPPDTESAVQNWELGGAGREEDGSGEIATAAGGVAFEDHTPEDGVSVGDFAQALAREARRRTVRIAFFGDSYIEGDIITSDIREQLQEAYGGQGVGFVAMGTPQAISYPSVRHGFGGWRNYNLIYKKSVPEEYKDWFAVSGTVSVPEQGRAWSEYKGTGFRKRLGSWSRARLIFVDNGGATIDIAVNDSITRRFTPEPDGRLQQISLTGNGMRSLRVEVDALEGGFMGYGVALEGRRGVAVDNYAIRSNSGIAMFGTNAELNAQLGRMLGYDMVVLQWGLNAMSPGVTEFKAYGSQLRRVINYMKACFPQSAIVVMGVGDRAAMRDGTMDTQEGIEAMIREQRAAAAACGVAFWNTFEAMGGRGSMVDFVEKGWAAKDYTHLSHSGGRQIATRFVQSLMNARGRQGAGTLGGGAAETESVELDLSQATAVENTGSTSVGDRAATIAGDSAGIATATDSVIVDTVREDSVMDTLGQRIITGRAAADSIHTEGVNDD